MRVSGACGSALTTMRFTSVMSIRVHETVLSTKQACRHPLLRRGSNRPLNRAVLERWFKRGLAGVVLESEKRGGLRVTSVEAIERFLDRLNHRTSPDGLTASHIAREHAKSEEVLDEHGM